MLRPLLVIPLFVLSVVTLPATAAVTKASHTALSSSVKKRGRDARATRKAIAVWWVLHVTFLRASAVAHLSKKSK
jgi:hypothetical protein